jgi:RNA polymerase sigma factor (sigma-70 family)
MDTVPIDEAAHMAVDPGGDNELVEELLACLDEEEQRLMRRRLEGYSVKEISKMLGISESNAKARLSRGRKALKSII